MATAANPPPGAMPVDEGNFSDPFLSSTPSGAQRQRFSAFDTQHFSLYTNGSPSQTRRALEAHLAETERRLTDAAKLGQTLVQQQTDLTDRLREVSGQQQQDEISPELKIKLLELEREVSEAARETARAFVVKNRAASGETPDASIFTSETQHSPSKVHAPTRKQRNQPSSRVNDLKLATDISTSLLAQVRDLQAAVADKDDALKAVTGEKLQLEEDHDGLRQRHRQLNESEQRFKDENWSLETQLHELTTTHQQAADREQRLTHSLNTIKAEKAAVEREFEELRLTYGKLSEEHTAIRKHHEAEVGVLKRDAAHEEMSRADLQKKLDDLTAQNGELARLVSYSRGLGLRTVSAESEFDGQNIPEDGDTPDNSPPGSPSKGTPRHGPLAAETLQSSLNHSQRNVQNLRNQLHREKTEKLDLRRLLQEARDELEARRGNGIDSGKKRKSGREPDLFKKPARPVRLGALRDETEEITVEDSDWEEHESLNTPSKHGAAITIARSANRGSITDFTDAYVTATENSDAFETADEANLTQTATFHTGAETLDGNSSIDLTEKEDDSSVSQIKIRKRSSPATRQSYQSSAYMSTDSDNERNGRTPVQQPPARMKVRISRAGARRISARMSSDALRSVSNGSRNSSLSIAGSSPAVPEAQSLFAELEGVSDDEMEEEASGSAMPSSLPFPALVKETPAPSEVRNVGSIKPSPVMVEAGVMTDPWEPKGVAHHASEMIGAAGAVLAGSLGFGLGRDVKKSHSQDASEKTQSQVESKDHYHAMSSHSPPPPVFTRSFMTTSHTEPKEIVAPNVDAPSFQASSILSQNIEPKEAEKVAPLLSQAPLISQHVEPFENVVDSEQAVLSGGHEQKPIALLTLSHILQQEFVPQAPLISQHVEPFENAVDSENAVLSNGHKQKPIAPLTLSHILQQEIVPVGPDRPTKSIKTAGVSTGTWTEPGLDTKSEQTSAGAQLAKAGGLGIFGSMLRRKKSFGEPVIAEDETSQEPRISIKKETGIPPSFHSSPAPLESRIPFSAIDGNAPPSPDRKPLKTTNTPKPFVLDTASESTQTTLSSVEIERMLRSETSTAGQSPNKTNPSPHSGAFQVGPSPRQSHSRDSATTVERAPRRAGSSGSVRSRGATPPPPLPQEARQVIAAAAAKKEPGTSTSNQFGNMGPPAMPASAMTGRHKDGLRPRTPQNTRQSSTMNNRNMIRPPMGSTPGRNSAISPAGTTRRSSVSSFASELDQRFNMITNESDNHGFDPSSTDPRMIQAITQTMIGEYLWKYTRKAGREAISDTRHRRFFWVHPYTRTLYWSDQDPATAGRQQLKAKSVAIEAVRVVTDDNPMPPGIHRKSLVVITPGRSIKFTASTGQRHETWFNALSYLLLRTGTETSDDGGLTAEEVEEFNPGYFRNSSRMTRGSHASMSSHMSRLTQRTLSPTRPTLTQRAPPERLQRMQPGQSQGSLSGRLSSLGGVFKPSSSLRGTSVRSRHSRNEITDGSVYEDAGSHSQDSAEDLRNAIENSEKSDRLENVRACCDGKHDVASLSQSSRQSSHAHGHNYLHMPGHSIIGGSRSVSRASGATPTLGKQEINGMDPADHHR